MEKVGIITGAAAPLLRDNIDTDVIIRVERLAGTSKASMGAVAFEVLRFHEDGSENPDFILNQAPFRNAPILISGANFGCGSSREGAVWAILGMGLRCVIAESFGDIFYNNCFQNGLLPVPLPAAEIQALAQQCADGHGKVTVNLEQQVVVAPGGETMPFAMEPMQRTALLEGLDDIGLTLKHADAIAAYQQQDRMARPWVWNAGGHG
jgi:3-isopropylmalate/(R)-2-methylmalate dehydratase small subunit